MVRCGHCRQTFDARPGFASDQPSPQLELPMLDIPAASADPSLAVLQPMTLAEQVAIIEDEDEGDRKYRANRRSWPWTAATLVALLLLLAQAAYFFRVELAARMPALKPALMHYCRLIKCDLPLPQHADLTGIESSELEADPDHVGWITLNALLRNRASYAQAFPNLELTLTDGQDQALARRIFRPADYLPPTASQAVGLKPNSELDIKLHLDTADLKPMGYRLMLFYPGR